MDNKYDILQMLRSVADGSTAPEDALLKLKEAPFEDLDYAKIDFHRSIRQGAAEVIYGAGKTPEQIAGIASRHGRKRMPEYPDHPGGTGDGGSPSGLDPGGISCFCPSGSGLPGGEARTGKHRGRHRRDQ